MREDQDMNIEHDIEQLVALAMGFSDASDSAASDSSAAEAHLAGCPACRQELRELREIDAAIRRVPPEAFLEGPPPDADLVLHRVLREVRAQSSGPPGAGSDGRSRQERRACGSAVPTRGRKRNSPRLSQGRATTSG